MGIFHQWFSKGRRDTPEVKMISPAAQNSTPAISTIPDEPEPFGYKIAWLAIQTNEAEKVLSLVADGKIVQVANWHSGIEAAYHTNGQVHSDVLTLFISPPVKGWVFIVGVPYLEAQSHPYLDEILHVLLPAFPEVQYFGSYRVVNYVGWAKAVNGQWLRRFAYADGKIMYNDGAFSAEERRLGLMELQELDCCDDFEVWLESEGSDEETVMHLAGLWSINPDDLPEMDLPLSVGWIVQIR